MQVKVYSTPGCPYCKMAKEYLSSKGVTFQDIDVSRDQAAVEEMVKISGQMGVPVILVDDNIIIGFDQTRIDLLIS